VNLFNRKTLKRHIKAGTLPADHETVLTEWAAMIRDNRIYSLKETALHGQFTARIVEGVLGYSGPASGADYTVATEKSILRGSVDLALGHFNGLSADIVAPFELKGAKTRDLDAIMPGRAKSPVQQAWEYATHARGVKWVLVSNYTELRLYGFGEGTQAYEKFDMAALANPAEYARFMLLLSAENLLSGRTLALLKESRREDKDITDSLYQDYKGLRQDLIGAVQSAAPATDPLDAIGMAQKVLDRVLFIAFAEDTGLLPQRTLEDAFITRDRYNPRPVWDNFKGLFRAIDQGDEDLKIPRYNGGLFRADSAIDALTLPDAICEGFRTLGAYDFASEVSVTVLGHIFEQSIADVERLQAIARGEEEEPVPATGTKGRRKRDGVVYTPDYIARFIVAETLGTHLQEIFATILSDHAKKGTEIADYTKIQWRRKSAELEAWQTYRYGLKTLRIVDPACGSGVFLIMAFDFMKAELARVNDKIAELVGRAHMDDLLDPDSEILTNNLFGVDVNAESVEITKLSLWIKTARRGKVLDSLSSNIRVGDSLIEDSSFAYLDHAFTWETAFPQVFAEGGFDVVLGNPPYVRMEFLKEMKPYLEKRYAVVSDRADLYCYFYERGLRLLKPGGRLGYISSSTFLRNGSGKPLRDYLIKEATIEKVVDFGDLQIFEGVATLPLIMTMRRGVATVEHAIQFWAVEKMPDNNFFAAWNKASGPFPQSALGPTSWELENSNLRELRGKIKLGYPTLKDVIGSPLYGIKSGLNSAFVIDDAAKERLCAQDPNSAELLKPFLEGKDLKRWRAEPRDLWVIYIPKNSIDIERYPAIRDYLAPLRNKLEARATKQEWFELQQAQDNYIEQFENPKIIYAEFNRRYFARDVTGTYFNNKIFMIPTEDMALLALLQSSVIWYLMISLAPQVIGGSREFRSQYIETLPVPFWDEACRAALARLSNKATIAANSRLALQTAFSRRIPDLCPSDRSPKLTTKLKEWWKLPDFAAFRAEIKKTFRTDIPLAERSDWEDWIARDRAEIARLSSQIRQAEIEIDRIVYDLFDLTDAEIALLEAAI
jgi:hypothetical protein